MTLDQLFCSIESAKRLRELGFTKESLFSWVHPWQKTRYIELKNSWITTDTYKVNGRTYYQAYTAAELLEVLPYQIFIEGKNYFLNIEKDDLNTFIVYYSFYGDFLDTCSSCDLNLAEACALCLIHLLENKLIDVREVNK